MLRRAPARTLAEQRTKPGNAYGPSWHGRGINSLYFATHKMPRPRRWGEPFAVGRYRHYAHRAPMAFKAIMTLPQSSAFRSQIDNGDERCPCCQRRFDDVGQLVAGRPRRGALADLRASADFTFAGEKVTVPGVGMPHLNAQRGGKATVCGPSNDSQASSKDFGRLVNSRDSSRQILRPTAAALLT